MRLFLGFLSVAGLFVLYWLWRKGGVQVASMTVDRSPLSSASGATSLGGWRGVPVPSPTVTPLNVTLASSANSRTAGFDYRSAFNFVDTAKVIQ
jgi:hypothetical protein